MKRILPLLLAFIFIFFTACNGNNGEISEETSDDVSPSAKAESVKDKPVRLPYSSSDSLHPFKANLAMNRQIASLIYDSLYALDESYEPKRSLASSEKMDDKILTVKLRKAVFSDGSALSARDVSASFLEAKKSGEYKQRLKNFNSCKASGSNEVTFTLSKSDPYATACLDFPIIMSDGKEEGRLPPIGSGRYIIKEKKGSPELTPNPRWREKLEYGTKSITLVNITDPSTLAEGVGIGSISFAVTDLSTGTAKHVSARTVQLPLNNLVYLTCNSNKNVLKDPKLRQAISLMLSREDLARGAFQGNAHPADTPFNPSWYERKNPTVQPQKRDAAAELIKSAGAAGIQLSQTTLTLLVNKDNPAKLECARRIMNTLQVGGLKVALKDLRFSEYKAAAVSGSFDLLLGEVRLTNNMDLFALFQKNGGAAYGIDTAGRVAQSYSEFRRSAVTLEEFLEVFASEMPFIPLVYRCGLAYYDRGLKADLPAPYDANVYASVIDFRY